jgi:hypothetical protein
MSLHRSVARDAVQSLVKGLVQHALCNAHRRSVSVVARAPLCTEATRSGDIRYPTPSATLPIGMSGRDARDETTVTRR